MPTAAAALARLRDPGAKVSAHYLIDEDGDVVQLVPEERRAWHAGVSAWQGRARLNDCSIGIELVNPGHEWGYRPFTEAQYDACIELCRAILARWPIRAAPRARAQRRRARAQAGSGRAVRLGAARRGRRRAVAAAGRRATASRRSAAGELARFGYEVAPSGRLDEATRTGHRGLPTPFPSGARRRPRRIAETLAPSRRSARAAVSA